MVILGHPVLGGRCHPNSTAGMGSWSCISNRLVACNLQSALLLPQPLAPYHRHTADGTELHGKNCRKTFIHFTPAESSATVAVSRNVKFARLPSHSHSPKRARVWSRDLSLSVKCLLDISLLWKKTPPALWKPSIMRIECPPWEISINYSAVEKKATVMIHIFQLQHKQLLLRHREPGLRNLVKWSHLQAGDSSQIYWSAEK